MFDYDSGTYAPFTAPGLATPTALIELAGGSNIFAALKQSWTSVSWEQVIARKPQCIIIKQLACAAGAVSPARPRDRRRFKIICSATRKDTHDCDGELLVVALESHAPVTDSQPVLVRALKSLDIACQFCTLRQPSDSTQDALAGWRVDPAEILASAVVNDDTPTGLAHRSPSNSAITLSIGTG